MRKCAREDNKGKEDRIAPIDVTAIQTAGTDPTSIIGGSVLIRLKFR
jgi:hypothetical protein